MSHLAIIQGRDRKPSPRSGLVVRLKAHLNSAVKVRDLADTVRPVTESNCTGAIPPGGEQLEVNNQSVTQNLLEWRLRSELDSAGGFGEPAAVKAKPEQNSAVSVEGVERVWQGTEGDRRQNGWKFK
jgi:hypothetical protein